MEGRKLELTAVIEPDGSYFTALCLELDIASFGRTPKAAFAALFDAVNEYLAYALSTGQEALLNRPVPDEIAKKYRTPIPKNERQHNAAAIRRKFTVPLAPPQAAAALANA